MRSKSHLGYSFEILLGVNGMTFAQKLRDLRTAKGWSQKELADKAGFAQSAIARWEAGQQIPAVDSFQSLCVALGVRCTVFDGVEYEQQTARPVGRPKKEASEPAPAEKPAAKGKRKK